MFVYEKSVKQNDSSSSVIEFNISKDADLLQEN